MNSTRRDHERPECTLFQIVPVGSPRLPESRDRHFRDSHIKTGMAPEPNERFREMAFLVQVECLAASAGGQGQTLLLGCPLSRGQLGDCAAPADRGRRWSTAGTSRERRVTSAVVPPSIRFPHPSRLRRAEWQILSLEDPWEVAARLLLRPSPTCFVLPSTLPDYPSVSQHLVGANPWPRPGESPDDNGGRRPRSISPPFSHPLLPAFRPSKCPLRSRGTPLETQNGRPGSPGRP